MALTPPELDAFLVAQLTEPELGRAVVYALAEAVTVGTLLKLLPLTVPIRREALLAFVDREPLANWGHSCRYILVDTETDEAVSVESRFLPFGRTKLVGWRIVYRAPFVPDSALATLE